MLSEGHDPAPGVPEPSENRDIETISENGHHTLDSEDPARPSEQSLMSNTQKDRAVLDWMSSQQEKPVIPNVDFNDDTNLDPRLGSSYNGPDNKHTSEIGSDLLEAAKDQRISREKFRSTIFSISSLTVVRN
ncbi:MAG: hypothetical protein Q9220_002690 [cf. Caloplaca sp. 1 TL-2023]